ncbi:MAG: alpha-hydroxy-acid oxidizing protein [Thermoplasmata archaeon]|nr:alpha-hydroxy-acid oxidizing protein [Thermoplasmata archaeon]
MSTSDSASPAFRTLAELERAGAARVPSAVWDYIQGGAGEERTRAANREAFHRCALLPKLLAGVERIDPTTTFLGSSVAVPFFLAPTAYQGQVHADGEPGTFAAASEAGVLAVLSSLSSFSLEATAQASGESPRWFQLYLQPEFSRTVELVQRAERAGFRALVLTADVPLLGVRDRQAQEGFGIDAPVPLGNGPEFVSPARGPTREGTSYRLRAEAASDWGVLGKLRSVTRLPLVVKGVLRRDDARRAVDGGAQGIIVSNHGGRQLDGAPATLDVLPGIVEEVGGRAEVFLDGGVRRATDVLIALALGARGVGIGRPVLWALGADGGAGVARYLRLLTAELVNSMAQLGVSTPADLRPDLVRG